MGIYRREGTKVYTMDFLFNGQRVRETTGMTSKVKAQEVFERRKRELKDAGAGLKKKERPVLFSAAAKKVQDAMGARWSPSMAEIAANAMTHLAPRFGKLLLVDIEAADIRAYQLHRQGEGASNRTINIEVTFLRQVMKWFGQWERVRSSQEWRAVGMLKERTDAGRALSRAEESMLLLECGRSASESLRPFVTLLLNTGARFNTIRTLTWGQVDFLNARLTIGKDKTSAGTGRLVPLNSEAMAALRARAAQFPDRKPWHYVFPTEKYGLHGEEGTFGGVVRVYKLDPEKPIGGIKKAWENMRARTRRHCPACKTGVLKAGFACDRDGCGFETDELPQGRARRRCPECKAGALRDKAREFACGSCGFTADELPEGLASLRLHDLRHTAVDRMVNNGTPLPTIAKIVGWSRSTTIAMALRYSHAGDVEMRKAVDGIGGGGDRVPPAAVTMEQGGTATVQ